MKLYTLLLLLVVLVRVTIVVVGGVLLAGIIMNIIQEKPLIRPNSDYFIPQEVSELESVESRGMECRFFNGQYNCM